MPEVVCFETIETNQNKLIAIATLNAERSLNALSVEMVDLLFTQLEGWQQDDAVVCVLLQGAGEKAFCAGGDIRRLYDTMIKCGAEIPNNYAHDFFGNEYRLDYLIHQYQKPLIVWGHGIVMGGGIGLMSGASHRVVTEKSRLAMPEINIGLFPDVGSTWFLNHTPGHSGLFLGLTGAHMNAADALFTGLADRFILHENKTSVLDSLTAATWSENNALNQAIVNRTLRQFEQRNELPESKVRHYFDLINEVCDGDSLIEIVENITAINSDDSWLQRATSSLNKGCPTTAHLVYQQLQRGKKLSLEAVFQLEFILALQCTRHPDFPEGVRALLVEKDGKPQWQHDCVASVPDTWVNEHFQAPWETGENPLSDLGQNEL